jgi:hypothetical protein
VPLFLREMSTRPGQSAGMHMWPTLVGGDRPLLVAAREAVETLELDVAWRLLEASSHAHTLGEPCRRLAAAFACRNPQDGKEWPHSPDPAPSATRLGRSLGMAAQRLRLVRDACARAKSPAEVVRYLVLAAGTVEVSVRDAGITPGIPSSKAFGDYRRNLERIAREPRTRPRHAEAAQVLLILNTARDRAPVTHGPGNDPDTAVRRAVADLTTTWSATADRLRASITNVPTLLDAALSAQEMLSGQLPGHDHASLTSLHESLTGNISAAIAADLARENRHRITPRQNHPATDDDSQR